MREFFGCVIFIAPFFHIYFFAKYHINMYISFMLFLHMSEDQKKQLETQLRNIANELRGKMNADEFRDYILGFIFYKYLSEKIDLYANELLKNDSIVYQDLDENSAD